MRVCLTWRLDLSGPDSLPSGSRRIGSPDSSTPQDGRLRLSDPFGAAMDSSKRKTVKINNKTNGIAISRVSLLEINMCSSKLGLRMPHAVA